MKVNLQMVEYSYKKPKSFDKLFNWKRVTLENVKLYKEILDIFLIDKISLMLQYQVMILTTKSVGKWLLNYLKI